MGSLREDVQIITQGSELQGHLFVGTDGLPELTVEYEHARDVGMHVHTGPLRYRPATFPAAWSLRAISEPGVLLGAWWALQGIQDELRQAQREAEQETPEPEDSITSYKRDADAKAVRR